jgi:hypothetical protein
MVRRQLMRGQHMYEVGGTRKVVHGGSVQSTEILSEKCFGACVQRRMTLYTDGGDGCNVSHDRRRSIVSSSAGDLLERRPIDRGLHRASQFDHHLVDRAFAPKNQSLCHDLLCHWTSLSWFKFDWLEENCSGLCSAVRETLRIRDIFIANDLTAFVQ